MDDHELDRLHIRAIQQGLHGTAAAILRERMRRLQQKGGEEMTMAG